MILIKMLAVCVLMGASISSEGGKIHKMVTSISNLPSHFFYNAKTCGSKLDRFGSALLSYAKHPKCLLAGFKALKGDAFHQQFQAMKLLESDTHDQIKQSLAKLAHCRLGGEEAACTDELLNPALAMVKKYFSDKAPGDLTKIQKTFQKIRFSRAGCLVSLQSFLRALVDDKDHQNCFKTVRISLSATDHLKADSLSSDDPILEALTNAINKIYAQFAKKISWIKSFEGLDPHVKQSAVDLLHCKLNENKCESKESDELNILHYLIRHNSTEAKDIPLTIKREIEALAQQVASLPSAQQTADVSAQ